MNIQFTMVQVLDRDSQDFRAQPRPAAEPTHPPSLETLESSPGELALSLLEYVFKLCQQPFKGLLDDLFTKCESNRALACPKQQRLLEMRGKFYVRRFEAYLVMCR